MPPAGGMRAWEAISDQCHRPQKNIKKGRRGWKLRLIEPSNPQWLDLYEQISQ